jgi:hypothetical protein
VILDLSFPAGNSVNDFISKDNYLGEIIQLAIDKLHPDIAVKNHRSDFRVIAPVI